MLENCHGISPSLSIAPSVSATTCTKHLPALVSMLHTSATIPVPGEGSLRVIAQVSGPGLGAAGPEERERAGCRLVHHSLGALVLLIVLP